MVICVCLDVWITIRIRTDGNSEPDRDFQLGFEAVRQDKLTTVVLGIAVQRLQYEGTWMDKNRKRYSASLYCNGPNRCTDHASRTEDRGKWVIVICAFDCEGTLTGAATRSFILGL